MLSYTTPATIAANNLEAERILGDKLSQSRTRETPEEVRQRCGDKTHARHSGEETLEETAARIAD